MLSYQSAKITHFGQQKNRESSKNTVRPLLEGRNPAADETMVIYDEPRSMAGQATSEDVSAISVSPSLLAAAAHYPTDASGI